MGNFFSLTCFKCEVANKISLDVIIDENCYRTGNTPILKDKMDHLRSLKADVTRRIEHDVRTQVDVSDVVKTWLGKVGQLDNEVSEILASDAASGRACCFLFSNNKFGILSRISRAEFLIRQEKDWKDSIFVERCTTANNSKEFIYTPPSSDADIVGMEQLMSQVLQYLNDAKVGVVGIHGMGGAGKTTLAKQLIKMLQSSPSSPTSAAAAGQESGKFDDIIWVTVSQSMDAGKLQHDVAVELGVHEDKGFKIEEDESIRARFLSRHLSERRFLLVLDDVWEKLDLNRIGIPELQENLGNKMVLTTREAKVCTDMGASAENIVKVGCLGKEESWELFQKTIKWKDGKFKEIGVYGIAHDIAAKCGGLPLGIITMARALATKSDISSWKYVRNELRVSPSQIQGMQGVYRLLEVSYENLRKEEYKSCLLYSALFPEDEEIEIKTMVDYYIGGESIFVAGSSRSSSSSSIPGDIFHLREKGRFIISELIDACLLERGKHEQHVKVHDAIRDMILKGTGIQNGGSKIVSYAGKQLTGIHVINFEEWQAASMLSLSNNRIKELAMEEEDHGRFTAQCSGMVEKSPCQSHNLRVLLVGSNRSLKNVPRRLFQYFPNLRVLDFSDTAIEEIPTSLFSLESLHYLDMSMSGIKALPKEIGNLRNLVQLNLSATNIHDLPKKMGNLRSLMQLSLAGTRIKALPKEMSNLRNLMQLDLSFTAQLCEIPNGLFSSLSKLQSLDILESAFFRHNGTEKRLQVLREIGEDLPLQGDVGLSTGSDVRAVKFLVDESDSLSASIVKLRIDGVDDLFKDDLFKRMGSRLKKLEWLRINSVRDGNMEQLVIDGGHFSELKELMLSKVDSFRQIILKRRALEHLTLLRISSCNAIVELMGPLHQDGYEIIHHLHQAILPKLRYIELTNCPKLVRISTSPLQLHSLEILTIYGCPLLRDISIVDSAHKVEIRCAKAWWEELRWENSEGAPPPNFKPSLW